MHTTYVTHVYTCDCCGKESMHIPGSEYKPQLGLIKVVNSSGDTVIGDVDGDPVDICDDCAIVIKECFATRSKQMLEARLDANILD